MKHPSISKVGLNSGASRAAAEHPIRSLEAMRSVCRLLRERLRELIPAPEKELMHFLYALRHAECCVPFGTRRCRPPRWRRKVPLRAAGELRFVLRRETSARISLSSFVGQYLPLLDFPADVLEALSAGRVNLAMRRRVRCSDLSCWCKELH